MLTSLKRPSFIGPTTAAAAVAQGDSSDHGSIESHPNGILELAFSFWHSRVLHTALELGLFTVLSKSANQQMTSHQLGMTLRLYPGAASDFLDALVSMNLLEKQGTGEEAMYSLGKESRRFLAKGSDTFIGDLLHKCDQQYKDWIDLIGILKKENPQAFHDIGGTMERDMRIAKVRLASSEDYPDANADGSSAQFLDDAFKLAYGFCPSRVLLTATELGVFTLLANAPDRKMTCQQLAKCLELDESRTEQWLSLLVGAKVLTRKLERKKFVYSNSSDAAKFLDQSKANYIGGVLTLTSQRLYQFWANLQDTLETGAPQCGHQDTWSADFYGQDGMGHVLVSLQSIHASWFQDVARAVDFSKYKTLVDVGGSTGLLSATIARQHKRMRCITADLPSIQPLAEQCVRELGLEGRVVSMGFDYLKDDFPRADAIAFSNVLSECNASEKRRLLRKVYEALPHGGVLIVLDTLVDDDRRQNSHGLLQALNMSLERGLDDDSYGYSQRDFTKWCTSLGFQKIETLELSGQGSQATFLAFK